jgi:hypothetical protein
MAKKSADHTAADYSAAPVIVWNAEVYDDEGFHDTMMNNSRFTVPPGATCVELGCTVALANVAARSLYSLALKKNGSSAFDGAVGLDNTNTTNTSPVISITSGPVSCVATDYFEWQLYCSDASIDVVAARSNAWMRVVA